MMEGERGDGELAWNDGVGFRLLGVESPLGSIHGKETAGHLVEEEIQTSFRRRELPLTVFQREFALH